MNVETHTNNRPTSVRSTAYDQGTESEFTVIRISFGEDKIKFLLNPGEPEIIKREFEKL